MLILPHYNLYEVYYLTWSEYLLKDCSQAHLMSSTLRLWYINYLFDWSMVFSAEVRTITGDRFIYKMLLLSMLWRFIYIARRAKLSNRTISCYLLKLRQLMINTNIACGREYSAWLKVTVSVAGDGHEIDINKLINSIPAMSKFAVWRYLFSKYNSIMKHLVASISSSRGNAAADGQQ